MYRWAMETVRLEMMIPKRFYRVTYQRGASQLDYRGKYMGLEVAYDGEYLLFERPNSGYPIEILTRSVRRVVAESE